MSTLVYHYIAVDVHRDSVCLEIIAALSRTVPLHGITQQKLPCTEQGEYVFGLTFDTTKKLHNEQEPFFEVVGYQFYLGSIKEGE